jgi:uncharacterized OB-fold protein
MQPSQKMRDDATGRYLPVIYPEELPFWEGAKKRALWLQRCNGCGKAWTPWFEQRVPYAVIQVELEEGPRLTTNMLDCPVSQVKIGMAVEVAYEDITGEITLVQFRPSVRYRALRK